MRQFIISFRHALNALPIILKERNFRFHLLAFVGVIGLSVYFDISRTEWVLILLCVMGVICLEIVNTALEKLCDKVEPNQDPLIKKVKDLSALAVLFASVISFVIGMLVFLPKF